MEKAHLVGDTGAPDIILEAEVSVAKADLHVIAATDVLCSDGDAAGVVAPQTVLLVADHLRAHLVLEGGGGKLRGSDACSHGAFESGLLEGLAGDAEEESRVVELVVVAGVLGVRGRVLDAAPLLGDGAARVVACLVGDPGGLDGLDPLVDGADLATGELVAKHGLNGDITLLVGDDHAGALVAHGGSECDFRHA